MSYEVDLLMDKIFTSSHRESLVEVCTFIQCYCLGKKPFKWDLVVELFEKLNSSNLEELDDAFLYGALCYTWVAKDVLVLKPAREKYYYLVKEQYQKRGLPEERIKKLLYNMI